MFILSCSQRPRKIGAKYTGSNFAPDEHIQPELAFDYDGKRDRWNGYNTNEHTKMAEDFARLEEVNINLTLTIVKQQALEFYLNMTESY